MEEFNIKIENLKQLINSQSRQSWLFGAGISYDSKIPLMNPLTDRVEQLINDESKKDERKLLDAIKTDLNENSHVEHYLSHLGDLLAIADRSKSGTAYIGDESYSKEQLKQLYVEIIKIIGEIVRYGYVAENKKLKNREEIGNAQDPIIEIEPHFQFIKALLFNKSNLEQRSKTTFFTTNYDTLLEDALALHKKTVCDGFSGGAVGFWNPEKEFTNNKLDADTYLLYKLHGSIDWHRDEKLGLVRARYGTKYLSKPEDIMIYPQATKYIETQKDPFARLFTGLRNTLMNDQQNTLFTCGYSFGDDHINAEIESALRSEGNQTTLVAFIQENPKASITINPILDNWLNCPKIGSRVYVAGQKGIYHASTKAVIDNVDPDYSWWRFDGITEFIRTEQI